MLELKIEELNNRTFSKEESKEDVDIDNNMKEQSLYNTSERLLKETEYLQGLIEANILLNQGWDQIEQMYLKKRHRKLSKNKKIKHLVTPRYFNQKSSTNRKSTKNLRSFTTVNSLKSCRRGKKSKPKMKNYTSYNASRDELEEDN